MARHRAWLLGLALAAACGHAPALVLPLQYNAYHPAQARSLGLGNCRSEIDGPAGLFGNPSGIDVPGLWDCLVTGSYLSGAKSHINLYSEGSLMLPGMAAAAGKFGKTVIAAGFRQSQSAKLSFPDPWHPYQQDRAELSLWQMGIGASAQLNENFRLGLAVSRAQASFNWQGPDSSYVDGQASGLGIDAGLKIRFSEDLSLQGTFSSKSALKGTNELGAASGSSNGQMEGAMPPRTSVGLRYRLEPDFTICAEAELVGWQTVTWGYVSRIDYKAGAELSFLGNRLAARLGAFTLLAPLEEADRSRDPDLHHMYFLSCGAGLALARLRLDFAAASSQPLSGHGLNQNLVAASAEYHFR